MRFRLLAATLCVAAVSLVLAACGSGGDDGSTNGGSVPTGGIVRIGTVSRLSSLNPYKVLGYTDYQLIPLLYPMLVQASPDGEMLPDFATSWRTSPDGKTWTFTTHDDGRWSDGTPLTAADAAFTINTTVKYADSTAGGFSYAVANVTKAEAPDATTLVVHFSKPSASFLNNLAGLFIVPEHVFAPYTKDKDGRALANFTNDKPNVAGGPFEVKKQTEESLLLSRNPGFYDAPAKIDGFGYRYYANDDALINALKAGEIDVADNLAPTAINAISNDPSLAVAKAEGGATNTLSFNVNPQRTTHKEILDPKVREAFDHAIDREKIAEVVYFGTAEPGGAFIPPGFKRWHADIPVPTFDVAEANRILDEAGYDRAADGTRVADGQPMSYEFIYQTSNQATDGRLLQILKDDFAQIGVQVKPTAVDDAKIVDAYNAGDGKESVAWLSNAGGTYDPQYLLNVWTCGLAFFRGGFNSSNYCSTQFDNLMEKQSTQLEESARRETVDSLQQTLATDRPFLVVVYRDWISAYSKKWAGFEPSVFGILNFYNHRSMVQVHRAS